MEMEEGMVGGTLILGALMNLLILRTHVMVMVEVTLEEVLERVEVEVLGKEKVVERVERVMVTILEGERGAAGGGKVVDDSSPLEFFLTLLCVRFV